MDTYRSVAAQTHQNQTQGTYMCFYQPAGSIAIFSCLSV